MASPSLLLLVLMVSSAVICHDLHHAVRRPQDPVSSFLSEMGGLFLDADRAIAVQSAPKVRFEDGLAGNLMRLVNPRKDQFTRIQDNYRGIQNQLGKMIARALSPALLGRQQLGGGLLPGLDLFQSPQDQLLATVDRILTETRRTGDILLGYGSGRQALDKRSGEAEVSETRFDQYLRQLLQNHGRWVLDSPLLQGFRPTEQQTTGAPTSETTPMDTGTTEPATEAWTSTTTTTTSAPTTTSARQHSPPVMDASYYAVDGGVKDDMETVRVVLQQEPRDTVLLAFTEDGVPLKLKLGPEVQNPVRHLHRILKASGVTLKVPVRSSEDPDPVGKEVLLLGSQSGMTVTRAVYLNLSNPDELRSLLRTLRRTKVQ